MSDWPFTHRETVRYADLDTMRHVNNVAWVRFFETARIAWIQQVMPEHAPTSRQEFGFIFAECHIAYRSPAFFDEELRTWIEPAELRRSSVRLDFTMRAEGDGRLVAEGWGVLVGYDYAAGRSKPIPDELRGRLGAPPRAPDAVE